MKSENDLCRPLRPEEERSDSDENVQYRHLKEGKRIAQSIIENSSVANKVANY